MAKVAEEVGVHLATVSRAVSGKYVQCPQGILPLRKFFCGGREDATGRTRSWEAIRAKLQQIIDAEDKAKPLNDEQIQQKLLEAGVKKLALFHHDPEHNDTFLLNIEGKCQKRFPDAFFAREGTEIEI